MSALGNFTTAIPLSLDTPEMQQRFVGGQQTRRTKQVAVGVALAGGGVAVGALVAPKLHVDRKVAALVGGGIGLVGALIASRWL